MNKSFLFFLVIIFNSSCADPWELTFSKEIMAMMEKVPLAEKIRIVVVSSTGDQGIKLTESQIKKIVQRYVKYMKVQSRVEQNYWLVKMDIGLALKKLRERKRKEE